MVTEHSALGGPAEVAHLGPPTEVTGSGLFWQRSLTWACSCRCPYLGVPAEVTGLGLVDEILIPLIAFGVLVKNSPNQYKNKLISVYLSIVCIMTF